MPPDEDLVLLGVMGDAASFLFSGSTGLQPDLRLASSVLHLITTRE